VPAVRECKAVKSVTITAGLPIRQESLDKNLADTRFAVEDLEQYLSARGIKTRTEQAVAVVFAPAKIQKATLALNRITFDPAMHDEGYAIVPDSRGGLMVIAETPAGFFYGAQTVKQLSVAAATTTSS